jgi:carbon-monoxide dehydrogenase medium subunit
VKPPRFDYAAPAHVDEALELLADPAQEEPKALAGGQSLVPLLNMRFARPTLLVDLNGVAELAGVEWVNGHLRIGAMTRQRVLEIDPRIRERLPLLGEAVSHVAHLAIRTRGTVGGSLAHADPAAELPAAISVLDARLVVRTATGSRTIEASDFFVGPFTTALAPGELLEAVEVPVPTRATGCAFVEAARVHGAFALAGVAALVALGEDRRIASARVALCGVGPSVVVPPWANDLLAGEAPGEELFAHVAERVRDEVEPADDLQASADYRRRVAATLTRRALAQAVERAA